MRILFYTGGTTGSGHIVRGLCVANAFKRAGVAHDFQLLSVETTFAGLAQRQGVDVRTIPLEDEDAIGPAQWRDSELFRSIDAFRPDILVVDLFWFALDAFIRELPCRKAILIRQVDPRFFRFRVRDREQAFRPADYDLVAAIEPGFRLPFESESLEPLVMRNRDEIKSEADARTDLGLKPDERTCFFGFNGNAWEGAGYNAFWEARYFDKQAFFAPFPRNFEDQRHRIAVNSDYVPAENGADQLH